MKKNVALLIMFLTTMGSGLFAGFSIQKWSEMNSQEKGCAGAFGVAGTAIVCNVDRAFRDLPAFSKNIPVRVATMAAVGIVTYLTACGKYTRSR